MLLDFFYPIYKKRVSSSLTISWRIITYAPTPHGHDYDYRPAARVRGRFPVGSTLEIQYRVQALVSSRLDIKYHILQTLSNTFVLAWSREEPVTEIVIIENVVPQKRRNFATVMELDEDIGVIMILKDHKSRTIKSL